MQFEWDEAKNKRNRKIHGLSFEEAIPAFLDPKRIERYDEAHSTADEERWIVIGDIGWNVIVFAVSTDRSGRTRIISARLAEEEEIDEYHKDYDAR